MDAAGWARLISGNGGNGKTTSVSGFSDFERSGSGELIRLAAGRDRQ